jgi:AcrR family transcriptional regulator
VPKRSQEHLDARREQILDGARRTFSRYGYSGATVTKLEQEIGLSRGAIFNYFPSKLDLFFALATADQARVVEAWLERGFPALLHEIAGESPDWLGVYVEHVRRLRTDARLRERWQARNVDLDRRARAHLQDLQERGEVRDDMSPEEIGQFLGVLLDGIALQTSAGFPVDVEPLLRLVADAIAPRE